MSCSQSPVVDERTNFFAYQHSILTEFIQALWFALIANTDVICYVLIFLQCIISMNILTLLMSLLVCLWGTLILPRPSKRFWLLIIAYTEVESRQTTGHMVFVLFLNSMVLELWLLTLFFFPLDYGLHTILFANNFTLSHIWDCKAKRHIQHHFATFCPLSQVFEYCFLFSNWCSFGFCLT